MTRSRPRRIALVATAASLLLSILAVTVALADGPTIEEVHVFRQIPGQCPGFAILATFEFDRRVTTFVDPDGTPIRQTIMPSSRASRPTCRRATRSRASGRATSKPTSGPARSRARARMPTSSSRAQARSSSAQDL